MLGLHKDHHIGLDFLFNGDINYTKETIKHLTIMYVSVPRGRGWGMVDPCSSELPTRRRLPAHGRHHAEGMVCTAGQRERRGEGVIQEATAERERTEYEETFEM